MDGNPGCGGMPRKLQETESDPAAQQSFLLRRRKTVVSGDRSLRRDFPAASGIVPEDSGVRRQGLCRHRIWNAEKSPVCSAPAVR